MPSVEVTAGVVSVKLEAGEASAAELVGHASKLLAAAAGLVPRSEQVGFTRSPAPSGVEAAPTAADPCPVCGHCLGWTHLPTGGCRGMASTGTGPCSCPQAWAPVAAV